tara:strand:- start:889 stop:999 length:111 start_codon:yes stop_codon:yes gene_type:complete
LRGKASGLVMASDLEQQDALSRHELFGEGERGGARL